MGTRIRPLIGKASWWLLERPVDRDRVGRRLLAFVGLWVLLGGMLMVLGLGRFALTASVVPLSVVLAVAAWLLLRSRARLAVRVALARVRRTLAALGARVRELELRRRSRRFGAGVAAVGARVLRSVRAKAPVARNAGAALGVAARRHARLAAAASSRHAGLLAAASRRGYASASVRASAVARDVRGAAANLPARFPAATSNRIERRREALRLNARGGRLRRSGDHAQAAEQHRAALTIVRDLGDTRLEALTLNDLALALIHTEGAAAAVQHLERALDVLRDLGDDEHEGRVTANLAFARRRQGRGEEADDLLQAALTKLAPDSSAYRRVEEQLRRAS